MIFIVSYLRNTQQQIPLLTGCGQIEIPPTSDWTMMLQSGEFFDRKTCQELDRLFLLFRRNRNGIPNRKQNETETIPSLDEDQ